MPTDKYDLHTIDYSVQGWDSILATDMEKLDDVIQSRLLGTLGETVAISKAVYIKPDGKYYKAQAILSKQPAQGLTVESGILDDPIRIQRVGVVTDTGWSWSVGLPVFLSPDSPGELTQEKSAVGNQLMGIAIAATTIVLFGNIDYVTSIVCVDNDVVCVDNNVVRL